MNRALCLLLLASSPVVAEPQLPRPEGLYYGVRLDDPQQEELVLWRFAGDTWNHAAGDALHYFSVQKPQLVDTPLGQFDWTGTELVLKAAADDCKPPDCRVANLEILSSDPQFTLSEPGSGAEVVYRVTNQWLLDFEAQIIAAERSRLRDIKPAGAFKGNADVRVGVGQAKDLALQLRQSLDNQDAARGRLPGWRADMMDEPHGTDARGQFFRVTASESSSVAGCFVLEGKRVARLLCPAKKFARNQRIEGIYRQRAPAVIPRRFEPQVYTFWRDGAVSHQLMQVRFQEQPIFEQVTEAGPYRLTDHAFGLRDMIASSNMVYTAAFAMGEWVDADTPRALYIGGRVFDYVGEPSPRAGPRRESIVFLPSPAGQPARTYLTWARLDLAADDPGVGKDWDGRELLAAEVDQLYRACRRPRDRDHGAKLAPLKANELAALRLPGVKYALRISELAPFGQFWDSSLEKGDVILGINGVRLESRAQFDRLYRLLEHTVCADGMRVEFAR